MTREEQSLSCFEKPVDYSPKSIAERCLKDIEPYFEKTLKEYIMKREEQDKLWAELSEEQKQERCNAYKMLKEIATPEEELSKYHLTSCELETLYGSHNLQPAL